MTEKTELPVNIQAVIDANVNDSPSMLGKLSPAELDRVAEAETAGEGRTTLLGAVKAEQESRSKDADDSLTLANEAAQRAGRAPIDSEAADKLASENTRLQQENEKLKSDLAAAKKKSGGRQPAKGKVSKPRTLKLGAAKIENARTVAFTGEDGRTSPDLPELEFGEGAFRKSRLGGGLELTEDIVFPQSVKKTQVSRIWLVDEKGNAAAVAQLINPLTVGGASNATIPANSLVFREEGNAAKLEGRAPRA